MSVLATERKKFTVEEKVRTCGGGVVRIYGLLTEIEIDVKEFETYTGVRSWQN